MTIEDDTDLCASAIRNVGQLIVRWNNGEGGQPHRLTWVNPLTSTVEMEVSLGGLQRFHFLDDRTLVGINSEEFHLVDLVDSTTQQCSFHIAGRDASGSPPINTDDANGPPDLPFWDPGRIQVSADALNYYVTNHAGNTAGPVRQPLGRQMARFEGGLRAVDRSTRKIRWWVDNDVTLLATTDQPELAVLLLIDDSPNPAIVGNSMASRNIFRGIAKLTGRELFKQAIPSQYGVRYLWISSPVPNTLDIGVQGMRVRLQGQTAQRGVPEE